MKKISIPNREKVLRMIARKKVDFLIASKECDSNVKWNLDI